MHYRTPPLADEVIDRLFSALVLKYGAPFLDRWRDLDLAVVKGDWARELAGFANNLEAIRWGLDHLPEKPPTVMDFKRCCQGARDTSPYAIEHNPNLRGPTQAEAAALASLGKPPANKDPLRWAREVLARHESGTRKATQTALRMAREALAAGSTLTENP
ncbi:hypothetical protein [Xenophilus sp. Marseille-Q4582]|uniref:hypothetical protein n=1 Tax=Xenophilus sp. Marseille-Q4582 TaxID=2866600 RepID=UPI001CE401A0|nr:hypothetical protein [Xenophilus sp. Marseille-Q4582]